MNAPSAPEVQWRVEQFYFREAELLDDRHLLDWVRLFTEDGTYTVSIHEKLLNRAQPSGPQADHTEVLHSDDRPFLEVRAKRLLETSLAHAEKPPSVTRRLISNVALSETEDGLTVRSNFVVFQARFHMYETTFFGTRRDVLVANEDSFLIRSRAVLLDQFTLARTLTVFF